MLIGICLGILIGLLSGSFFWWLVGTMWKASIKQSPIIAGQLFAIPTFWFGAKWLSAPLLDPINRTEMLEPYIVTLTCIFGVIAAVRILQRIKSYGEGRRKVEKQLAKRSSHV